MHRNQSVMAHNFAMVPQADIPRSAFETPYGYKTTFDAGYLVPFLLQEVYPGDTFAMDSTLFIRMTTPLYPIMDNIFVDTHFFFVPNRLVWTNWVKFMGEQANPADSISYSIPQQVSPASGYVANSLQDYFALPTVGQVTGGLTTTNSALPLRAYNLIWNQWYRDENLQNSVTVDTGDGPDTYSNYVLLRRGKRADYFTTCLPNPQKGATAVTLPLGTSAPVVTTGVTPNISQAASSLTNVNLQGLSVANNPVGISGSTFSVTGPITWGNQTGLQANLSAATGATINAIRLAFQTQKLLERDARGGTRYTEIIRSHFGVVSPDARLQRPEYLGGGTTTVNISPIAQQSQTGLTGGSTPLGTLAAMGTALAHGHGFMQSFTEHGIIIGLVSTRADLTYQQGLDRYWSRLTRYDFYFPVFSHLGEQAVLQKEIYITGNSGADNTVFGYQEAWADLRYKPSKITGQFRSTYATPLDGWHLSQKFTSAPTLNTTFIQDTPPLSRILAVGAAANGQQFYMDSLTKIRAVRQLPLDSAPGLIDHF